MRRIIIPSISCVLLWACGTDSKTPSDPGATADGGATRDAGADARRETDEVCEPDTTEACYEGPEGTLGVGVCVAGTRTCMFNGRWSDCRDARSPGYDDCSTPEDEDCDGSPAPCAPEHMWSKSYDVDVQDAAIVADSSHVLVGLSVWDTVDFGTGPVTPDDTDVAVLRFSTEGVLERVMTKPQPGDQRMADIALRPDGAFAVASDKPSFAMFDEEGEQIWSHRVEDHYGHEYPAVAFMPNGDVATSYSFSTPSNGEGFTIAIYRAVDGGEIHQLSEGLSRGDQYVQDIDVTADGTVVVAGIHEAAFEIGGSSIPSPANRALFIAALDGDLVHVWSHSFELTDEAEVVDVSTDGANRVVVNFDLRGAVDVSGSPVAPAGTGGIAMIVLEADGTVARSRAYGEEDGSHWLNGAAVNAGGRTVVVGYTSGTINFGDGPISPPEELTAGRDFLAWLDQDGVPLYTNVFHATGAQAVAATDASEIYLTGQSLGDWGGGNLAHYGLFVVKLKP